MLQEICEHIHNYFISSRFQGTYTIADGMLSPAPDLKNGQRFLVSGSDPNDGIYTWRTDGIRDDDDIAGAGLADEVFSGAICGLSIPPQLAALSAEIREWVGTYGDVIASPYQSESFGGYSYTRASAAGSAGGSMAAGWQEVFANRLHRWRKVSFL